jgi:hypothetical protein
MKYMEIELNGKHSPSWGCCSFAILWKIVSPLAKGD